MIFHVLLQKNLERNGNFSLNRLLLGIADIIGQLLGIMNLKNTSIPKLEELQSLCQIVQIVLSNVLLIPKCPGVVPATSDVAGFE